MTQKRRQEEQSSASFSKHVSKKQKSNKWPSASNESRKASSPVVSASQISSATDRNGDAAKSNASQRLSLLVQLATELQSDPALQNACVAMKSDRFLEAAKDLSNVVRSSPQLIDSLYQSEFSASDLNLPVVPKLSAHLAQNPSALPALPPISDAHLEEIVFTCKGTLGVTAGMAGYANDSYERLEVLGDAYIEVIATRLIFARYPHSLPGWLVGVREGLVNNETLAQFSMAYQFDQRANVPKHYVQGGVNLRKAWVKTMGDIFEAYVGAIIECDQQNGFATAERWLSNLWASRLPSEKSMHQENKSAKQELAQKILSGGIRLEYMEEAPPKKDVATGKEIFSVGVYLTGWGWTKQHLGSGKGPGKTTAGTFAAMEALLNPLTAQAAAVKRAHYQKQEKTLENQTDAA